MKQSSDDIRSRAAAAIDSAEPLLVRADEIAFRAPRARASRRSASLASPWTARFGHAIHRVRGRHAAGSNQRPGISGAARPYSWPGATSGPRHGADVHRLWSDGAMGDV